MRKLIAAMKLSLDGKYEGADGMADWVEAWSDDYDLTPQIDACVVGGGMYPGYERYWTSIQTAPDAPAWITGAPPTLAEKAWARFAARMPHYVLSRTLTSAQWPNTRFLRSFDELAALKRQSGKDIYLMGGGTIVGRLIDAGLVDELRLIVYPLVAGEGKSLFAAIKRRALKLHDIQRLSDERLSLIYGIAAARAQSAAA